METNITLNEQQFMILRELLELEVKENWSGTTRAILRQIIQKLENND